MFPFNIGSSDCSAFRLVSLTRDVYTQLSMICLGGRDRLKLLATLDYMDLFIFVKGSRSFKQGFLKVVKDISLRGGLC